MSGFGIVPDVTFEGQPVGFERGFEMGRLFETLRNRTGCFVIVVHPDNVDFAASMLARFGYSGKFEDVPGETFVRLTGDLPGSGSTNSDSPQVGS